LNAIDVLAPGLQTTVQDLGRWGHQSIGVPVAGPMDPFAHRLANALVGNDRSAATLEVTLQGPTLRFGDARTVAIAGAQFDLFLDDVQIGASSFPVRPGAVLRFGERRRGARAYVGVSGGFDVPLVLGSRSTHVPTHTGGLDGRALIRGDRLPLGTPIKPGRGVGSLDPTIQGARGRAEIEIPLHAASPAVRVLPGPQDDRFTSDALAVLASAPYYVTVDSNRMGFRLEGGALRHRAGADIISDATPMGSIQVPASGQPLLLMADRQTTGGYAKLATIISADIGVAGQAAPGDRIQFQLCSRAEAVAALLARERPLLAIETST
jgi:antagonist of KipI